MSFREKCKSHNTDLLTRECTSSEQGDGDDQGVRDSALGSCIREAIEVGSMENYESHSTDLLTKEHTLYKQDDRYHVATVDVRGGGQGGTDGNSGLYPMGPELNKPVTASSTRSEHLPLNENLIPVISNESQDSSISEVFTSGFKRSAETSDVNPPNPVYEPPDDSFTEKRKKKKACAAKNPEKKKNHQKEMEKMIEELLQENRLYNNTIETLVKEIGEVKQMIAILLSCKRGDGYHNISGGAGGSQEETTGESRSSPRGTELHKFGETSLSVSSADFPSNENLNASTLEKFSMSSFSETSTSGFERPAATSDDSFCVNVNPPNKACESSDNRSKVTPRKKNTGSKRYTREYQQKLEKRCNELIGESIELHILNETLKLQTAALRELLARVVRTRNQMFNIM